MAKPQPIQPTDAELEILRVLWTQGPSTVRAVHDRLSASKDAGYTTILKLMQNMTAKGFVTRDESQRSHVYHARCQQEVTERRLVEELLDRAFSGAADRLVSHALNARKMTPKEIAEIRSLLDQLEQDR